ncbi:hypothetical protein [Salinispora fenicalii]|uniref:hypothetical protein n=1 Tax=Salinispora fenicalii TaxID=1137263 RepID=UPI0003AB0D96|nr:hypothetical protein [Salinispora fenicalii]
MSACLVLGAVLGAVTSCGADREAPVETMGIVDQHSPASGEVAERNARKAALAAYSGYLAVAQEASGDSDPHHPELTTYLADPLLTQVRFTIRTAKEHGAIRIGILRSDPVVTAVDVASVPAIVEIQDCLDATDWRLVYAEDERVVPGSQSTRHLATVTVSRYPDGRWLVNTGAAHEDQPC